MAWIERTGQHNWRVRYLHDHHHQDDNHSQYGSVSGFTSAKAAADYANDLESDRRRGTWFDPAAAKTTVSAWASMWIQTLDVETRTEENYRAYLRNHIHPRWGHTALGDITALDVTAWLKDLRTRFAVSTANGILTVFSMLLDDAVDQRLIPVNPVHQRRRRGRRRDHAPSRVEGVGDARACLPHRRTSRDPGWPLRRATDHHGCVDRLPLGRVGRSATRPRRHGPWRDRHRSGVWSLARVLRAWPLARTTKTPASARTITLPPFLIERWASPATTRGTFVFTSLLGYRLRRSTFDRRVFRPAVDGDPRRGIYPVRPGLTFHGLRHSHKTWLIADHIPDIAQAKRLGHHLSDRLAEVYSHVAPEIETELLKSLERRWYYAHQTRRPADNRPHRKPTTPRSAPRAPHRAAALRTASKPRRQHARSQLTVPLTVHSAQKQEAKVLPDSSTTVHYADHHPHRITLKDS